MECLKDGTAMTSKELGEEEIMQILKMKVSGYEDKYFYSLKGNGGDLYSFDCDENR